MCCSDQLNPPPITDMQKRSLDHFVCLSSSVGGTMIPTSFHDDVMAGSSKRLARCLHPEASSQNNGVNIFSLISSGIPVPLSRMRISTLSPSCGRTEQPLEN
jgi:hypothetical protein